MDSDIRLNAMAGACGVSPEHFLRMFKSTDGVSPYQYLLNQRVERAKILLPDQTCTLAEVALRGGFSHREHLSRMFRRFTGVAPVATGAPATRISPPHFFGFVQSRTDFVQAGG
jgi:AraC family transcriptional regulator